MNIQSREDALKADETDPLLRARAEFNFPEGVRYFVGHSLGPPNKAALSAVKHAAESEWAVGLVGSWNSAGWFDLTEAIGAKLAKLIGAKPNEVMVTDTVSINLFKLAHAALPLSIGARQICVDAGEFPTDQYIADSFAEIAGIPCRRVSAQDEEQALAQGGVHIKSAVNYRSGARANMAACEALASKSGALIIWDLSHATGVVAMDMARDRVKLATGCTYKYLNGGPGAPSFIYAAEDLLHKLNTPLPGWMGHARPFAFEPKYEPRDSAARFASGTPPILSLRALDAALDSFEGLDMKALDAKAGALGDLCIALADTLGFTVMSPRDASARGGHISLSVENGYAITCALHARGFHTDFRTPDTIRFGFSPLYIGYADVWDVIEALGEIIETGEWGRPEFLKKNKVT